jgi:hypothetical protein
MARPSFLYEWVSGVEPHDAPDSTTKANGLTPNRLPAAWLNHWLVGLKAIWDDWLYPISARYLRYRIYDSWRVDHEWAGSYTRPVWTLTANAASGHVGYPRQTQQQSAEDVGSVVMEVRLPPGTAKLQDIQVRIKPATGHSTVPTTLPKIRVIVWNLLTDTATATLNATDLSATAGSAVGAQITAYETAHYLQVGDGLDQDIDPDTDKIIVEIYGEAGSGSAFQAGLEVRGARVQYELDIWDAFVQGDEI